jgi:hypothetical protein
MCACELTDYGGWNMLDGWSGDAIDVGWKVGNYLLKYLLSSLPII